MSSRFVNLIPADDEQTGREVSLIPVDDPPSPSFMEPIKRGIIDAGKKTVGILENVANQATQLSALTVTAVPNIIGSTGAELAESLVQERMPTLQGISDKFHSNLDAQIYQPQTEEGQKQVETTVNVLTAIPQAVDAVDEATGNHFKENFPNTYAATQVAGEFAPFIVAGKGIHGEMAKPEVPRIDFEVDPAKLEENRKDEGLQTEAAPRTKDVTLMPVESSPVHPPDSVDPEPGGLGVLGESAAAAGVADTEGKAPGFLDAQGVLGKEVTDAHAREEQPLEGMQPNSAENQVETADGITRPGPGAQTGASTRETGSDISQLRESLDGMVKPSTPLSERIQIGKRLAEGISVAKDTASKAIANLKGISEAVWSAYRNPPEWTDFKEALGKYTGERQATAIDTSRFAKEINKALTPEVQEGVTNWIEAGGNRDVLQQRLDSTTNRKLQKGYEAALNLSPEHIQIAENIRNYFESRLDQAAEAGVIEHGVENYVNHIWDKSNAHSRKVTSEINAGLLRTNPELARQRFWQTFFEGEQAGGVPKDKRIGYLVTAYDQALNEAIASRSFIKSLLEGQAKDGRPLVAVSGSGKPILEGEATKGHVIRTTTRPEDTADYRSLSHSSLKKWKWAGSDAEGKPIIMQGDMLVHPEIYQHMKNILGKSAIREYELGGVKPGKLLLDGIQELKSTLLSMSFFHQVQEGVHAVGHEVNPFKAPEIDLEHPAQRSLVDHGLMVFNHNAMQEFGEGVSSSGLINKIPVLGKIHQSYGQYLFSDYIPRLKMKMALDAYERNLKRYGNKLTDDQIQELTANQANAAFGELNYQMIGRNKTMQDVFRLIALAPDFLEARAKFAGQALTPQGTEQAAALLRLSAIMAITAQTTNFIISGEPNWSHPFSIKIKGKYYALRSVPGDIIHLMDNTRGFFYNRLNPTIARPLVEALTGRDAFGRERHWQTQLVDWAKNHAPIPVQGPLWKADQGPTDAILQSMGIGSVATRTPAEKKAHELVLKSIPLSERTSEEMDKIRLKGKITDALRTKDPAAHSLIAHAKRDKLITMKDEQHLRKMASTPPLVNTITHLDMPKAFEVWQEADPREKRQIKTTLLDKGERYLESHPDQEKETRKQLTEIRRFVR